MSSLSIPFALDPHGSEVPIEEARRKLEYYRCPECKEFVTPRKGSKRQYFAHRIGALEDTSCSLSNQADIDEMVDELRTSDIEEGEKERSIRLYIGERYEGTIECFGVIPALEWGQFLPTEDVDSLLTNLRISTSGVADPPVPSNFHPSESETTFIMDEEADEFRVEIEGPDMFDSITGTWTAEGLSAGNLFVGDQRRARRHLTNRQVKEGEWVYLVTSVAPPDLPDLVTVYEFAGFDVLAFPAREAAADLLEEYGDGLTTDEFGFDADVLLPPDAHPTVEAPVYGELNEQALVGVTPAPELDPTFEVVAIPRREGAPIDLDPVGPGHPRFYSTTFPLEGSRRVSIHQRNSNRHRLVHLHTDPETERWVEQSDCWTIALQIHRNGEDITLSPVGDQQTALFDETSNPQALPTLLEYRGPEDLELEVTGEFVPPSTFAPRLTRFTTDIRDLAGELVNWVHNGCHTVTIDFDGYGSVSLEFEQPALATALDDAVDQEADS